MEYINLGPTDQLVSKIGFGTARFHFEDGILRRAVELGMSLIDTAESYNTWGDAPGVGERHVGEQIAGFRDKVFVATKISPSNLRYEDVLEHAEMSRQRLNIEVIDLYQIHAPNHRVQLAETMRAMERLVADGVIRFIGVSNFSVEDLKAAQDVLAKGTLVSNQVKYNLFDREIEADVLPYCKEHGITVIAYEPLALGRITEGSGREELRRIATEAGKTLAQVMLNWLVGHVGVTTIPKTDRLERVDELAGSVGWALTPEHRAALEMAG